MAVMEPGQTLTTISAAIAEETLNPGRRLWWWGGFLIAVAFTALFVLAIEYLFIAGIGIWGVDIPVAWGFAIANYVWWIGIASGGTIISALFYLTGSAWRSAVNRIAESMTLFAAAAAGVMPILHLGRPSFFYWLFPLPNSMGLWPQFRSPLLWDFFAIVAYVVSSVLFWYLGLLPDLALVRDRAVTPRRPFCYGVASRHGRAPAPDRAVARDTRTAQTRRHRRQWRKNPTAAGCGIAATAPSN